jgi:two-component system sensor histidine kinase UhpB
MSSSMPTAHSVNVLLELRGDNLALVVEDDGVGCHPAARGETMIGLTGMRERAFAVGGTLEIEPTPGGGTTVSDVHSDDRPTSPTFGDASRGWCVRGCEFSD